MKLKLNGRNVCPCLSLTRYKHFEDAVAGVHPKNGEVTLRIRREVALVDDPNLMEGLNTIARAMQTLRDRGWAAGSDPAGRMEV